MFTTIVWATDGSENADRALSVAKALARENGAPLVVVHIIEKYASHRAAGLTVYADEEQVEAKLKRVVEELSGEGLNASLRIVDHIGPQPAHEIADLAREVGADLIVVGTRGHAALSGLLLGSVTQRLLHVAPCPTLVVPASRQPANDLEPDPSLTGK
jgi:nucleotide-binding universal stress UspA family protein